MTPETSRNKTCCRTEVSTTNDLRAVCVFPSVCDVLLSVRSNGRLMLLAFFQNYCSREACLHALIELQKGIKEGERAWLLGSLLRLLVVHAHRKWPFIFQQTNTIETLCTALFHQHHKRWKEFEGQLEGGLCCQVSQACVTRHMNTGYLCIYPTR